MAKKSDGKPNAWITLIGFLFLLVGTYASIRTAINLVVFPKYPTGGVLSFGLATIYGPREEDCIMYPPPYTDEIVLSDDISNKTDPGKLEEKQKKAEEQAKRQQESCISAAVQARYQTKVNDISQSLLLLILGGGVLLVRKHLFT